MPAHILFPPLLELLTQYKNISEALKQALYVWINRCDGFLYDTELITKDNSLEFLINKAILLISDLPTTCHELDFCHLLANHFEALYFHSSGKNQQGQKLYWHSISQSYSDFKLSVLPRTLQNDYLDQKSLSSEEVFNYLLKHALAETRKANR